MATSDATATAETSEVTGARGTRLRLWNAVMAVLHAIQGVAMVALAGSVLWPVTRTRYGFDPATETIAPETVTFVDANLPLLVAGFLFVSATAHTVVSTVRYDSYVDYLDRGMTSSEASASSDPKRAYVTASAANAAATPANGRPSPV